MELIDRYNTEIEKDLEIDYTNILQVQLRLPANKHKWVSRLISAKRAKYKYEKERKNIYDGVLAKMDIPPGTTARGIEGKISKTIAIQEIDKKITDTNIVIEYLERVENIFKSMTFDIKNIVEIQKLETT